MSPGPCRPKMINMTTSTQSDDFTTTFYVDQTPDEVFDAVNNVRGWWSENVEGPTDKVGEEFTYRYEDHHLSRIRVTELVPGEKVAWLVVENHFDFTQDKSEWTGTQIQFEIMRDGNRTEVRFTHVGLGPDYECFDVCSNSWGFYLNTSLRGLIRTGRGVPNPKNHK